MILRALLLAVVWGALFGTASPLTLAGGMILAVLVLNWMEPNRGLGRVNPWGLVRLLGVFLLELFKANLQVLAACVSPRPRFARAVLAYPLSLPGPAHWATLANLVTLTPGTLTLEIDETNRTLYLHALFASDLDEVRLSVRRLEQAVGEAWPT